MPLDVNSKEAEHYFRGISRGLGPEHQEAVEKLMANRAREKEKLRANPMSKEDKLAEARAERSRKKYIHSEQPGTPSNDTTKFPK